MITSFLLPHQLEKILILVFRGAVVRVIRIISQAGRSRVPWIYLVNRNGKRRATFVSVKELNLAFLRYLNQCNCEALPTVDRMGIRCRESFALSDAMKSLLKPGDTVFKHGRNSIGVVIEKNEQSLFVDWGDSLPLPEFPFLLELF
ncbi:MAG: hypothetical protein ACRC2R_15810 [Xenococcaceae cyanobacterium]